MSLPLPGMTFLYELDNRAIRKFAHILYKDAGLNMRSGMLTPSLSVLSTEAIIRMYVLVRAYRRVGSFELTTAEGALQTELRSAGVFVPSVGCVRRMEALLGLACKCWVHG